MTGLIEKARRNVAERDQFEICPVLVSDMADALEKLRGYTIHDLDCGEGHSRPDGTAPCTCGLDALLKEIGGE